MIIMTCACDSDIINKIAFYIKSWRLHSSLDYSNEIDDEICNDLAIGIVALIDSEYHGKV